MAAFQTIAGYKFFTFENYKEIRFPLRTFCRDLGLKGTILLSPEGINSFLAGSPEAVQKYWDHLHQEVQIPLMDYKIQSVDFQPFSRMLVKIKKEIITMGVEEMIPLRSTGPRLSPKEFKNWLDENKEMVVLDTRNDYEIEFGKFKSAIDLRVKSFRDFAKNAATLPDSMKSKPVVMYCTGGIRCEKASALFIDKLGFKEVYQLDGGILNYLKECGYAHYEGECFVFDERVTSNQKVKSSL